jgi:Family of unknown function (DUF5681)
MTDRDNSSQVGYGNPPKQTRFVKGQSGNPTGRPKGAKNLATIFIEACRERITVNRNGRKVRMTKFAASMHQLVNKAAGGDLKAIRDLLYWSRLFTETEPQSQPFATMDENDKIVMATILKRIRQSEGLEASPNTTHNPSSGQQESE